MSFVKGVDGSDSCGKKIRFKEISFLPASILRAAYCKYKPNVFIEAAYSTAALSLDVQNYLKLPYVDQCLIDLNEEILSKLGNYEFSCQLLLTWLAEVVCSYFDKSSVSNVVISRESDSLSFRVNSNLSALDWNHQGLLLVSSEPSILADAHLYYWVLYCYLADKDYLVFSRQQDNDGEVVIGKVFRAAE